MNAAVDIRRKLLPWNSSFRQLKTAEFRLGWDCDGMLSTSARCRPTQHGSPAVSRRSLKPTFHDSDTDFLARILADTSDTRAISSSYSCGKLNDTPTFSRRSSRGCRRRCRRRGMWALTNVEKPPDCRVELVDRVRSSTISRHSFSPYEIQLFSVA